MAEAIQRNPDTAPGDWYVDTRCIDCGASRTIAPGLCVAHQGLTVFVRQPADEEQTIAAWRAALACPTGSIRREAVVAPPEGLFPQELAPGVYRCGYNAVASFGAHSYFLARPGGNLLIDSPRFVPKLAKQFDTWGGIADILITHQDDVADAGRYAARYGSRVWIHEDDADDVPCATRLVRGGDVMPVRAGISAIPVPGHTKGSVAYLVDDRFLFTGDTLAWDLAGEKLTAFRDACWHSWSAQRRSLQRLLGFGFEWVLPGHGGHVQLAGDEMRRQIEALVEDMA